MTRDYLRIVKQDLSGSISRIGRLAAVHVIRSIDQPINDTGIYVQFATEEQAIAYAKAVKALMKEIKEVTS